jgi:MFS transporter, DHA1 family, multidrug resistance protein
MSLSTLAIAAVVLVAFVDTFSQFPVIAPYARSLGAGPVLIGVVVAIYSATNLGGNVLAGYLIDRLGRKPLLVFGLLASAGALLLYSAAAEPMGLVAVRGIHGLAAAILTPAAFTLLGDLFPKERRGRAMGASGALIAVAAVIAPPTSGVIRDRLGFDAVFIAVAALMAATALLAQMLLKDSYRPSLEERRPPGVVLSLLARPPLIIAYVTAVALTYGLGSIVAFLALRLEDLGYQAAHTGSAFSAFAVIALVVMAGPISRSAPGRGRVGRIGWGLVFAGVSLLVLAVSPGLPMVIAGMAIYGLGFGLIFPAVNALVADVTQPYERGTAFGLFFAFYSLGVVMGASIGGLIAGVPMIAFAPFVLSGLIGLAAGAGVLLSATRVRFPTPAS